MCWCNPSIRTSCCGKVGCFPKINDSVYQAWKNKNEIGSFTKEVVLSVDKKDYDEVKNLLLETLSMLEYSHTTSEQYYNYSNVSVFIENIKKQCEKLP